MRRGVAVSAVALGVSAEYGAPGGTDSVVRGPRPFARALGLGEAPGPELTDERPSRVACTASCVSRERASKPFPSRSCPAVASRRAERGLREGSDPAAPEGPRDPLSEECREGARGGADGGGKGFFPPLPIGSRRLRGERRRASQTDVRARVQSDPGGRVHASRVRAPGRAESGASLSVWRRRRHPHSCLLAWRSPRDRGDRRATVRGVPESRRRLKRLST